MRMFVRTDESWIQPVPQMLYDNHLIRRSSILKIDRRSVHKWIHGFGSFDVVPTLHRNILKDVSCITFPFSFLERLFLKCTSMKKLAQWNESKTNTLDPQQFYLTVLMHPFLLRALPLNEASPLPVQVDSSIHFSEPLNKRDTVRTNKKSDRWIYQDQPVTIERSTHP